MSLWHVPLVEQHFGALVQRHTVGESATRFLAVRATRRRAVRVVFELLASGRECDRQVRVRVWQGWSGRNVDRTEENKSRSAFISRTRNTTADSPS